jgi:hypothetical protein
MKKENFKALAVLGVFLLAVGFVTGSAASSLYSIEVSNSIDTDLSVSNNNQTNIVQAPSSTVVRKPRLDSIALVRGNQVIERLYKFGGYGQKSIAFGLPTDIYLVGDWDGDGVDTLAVYRRNNGMFIYTNSRNQIDISNNVGVFSFSFGVSNTTHLPVAGDWDGDGKDSIGIYNPSNGKFFLRNSMSAGFANYEFTVGTSPANKFPIAGDWDGNGTASVGLYDPSTGNVILSNRLSNGGAVAADYIYNVTGYGNIQLPADKIKVFAGDWANQGFDVPGVYNPENAGVYLRYTHGAPFLIYGFTYGTYPLDANSQVLAGTWAKIDY